MKVALVSKVGLTSSLLLAFVTINASALEVKPLAKIGYDFDGDTLATARFTDGSSESIKSNQGIYFGGGISLINEAKDIEGEISASYKFHKVDASNGDITWSRWPIEALAFYRFSKVRVGGGITYHLGSKLKGSGAASYMTTDYNDPLGLILQADWRVTDSINIGLRYTKIDYKANNSSKVNGDGLGLVMSASF